MTVVKVVAKSAFALVDLALPRLAGTRVLIYHQVGTDLGREMEVPARAFARQLDWMRTHGGIVDLETAIDRRDDPVAEGRFVLTFDDGFADVHRHAFPLLREHGIPFTLYLTTRPVDTGKPMDPRHPDARPITWGQVNEMVATGLVTIGAHTHTHPDLSELTLDRIADELDTSNDLIEDCTGIRPRHFTYPWGRWSAKADPLVRARYDSATVGTGPGLSADSDVYRLHRVPVQRSDAGPLFVRKMRTGGRLEAVVRRRLRGYEGG
ncbi:MAG TPA: polysaccharide deacetylase family protein [Acidimicrobiia bacterium]|nr:polysaccharide deacetylase family protein [Acidimicrobiia bacterium]